MYRNTRTHTKNSLLKLMKIKESGCWDFTGPINTHGYGVVGWKGKVVGAHRLSYLLNVGPIPTGLLVCHSCDNRKCINPSHLFVGTYKDNTQDMFKKGRNKAITHKETHCRKGHEFTKENTYTNKNGHRTCRICSKKRSLDRYYASKEKYLTK